MSTVVITPKIQMDFGSGWEDVSVDVVSRVSVEWGIHASDPKARIADPGSMKFNLNNDDTNSAATRNYYNPDSDAARTGFNIGTPVRLVLSHPFFGERVRWVGVVEDAKPKPGIKDPVVAVTCADWMDEAQRAKPQGLAVETDIQSDDLFEIIMGSVATQPPGGFIAGSGSDIYPFALDNLQDESSRVHSELARLCMSEYGLCYVTAGVAVFEGRRRRGGSGSVKWSFDESADVIGMKTSHGRDNVINRVQVSVHPRRVDSAATTALFNLGSAMEIKRNTSVTIQCPYRDPNQQAQRVGGIDMVTPVPSTDYTFNTAADGGGVDITSQLEITPDFGGNSAQVTIDNHGPLDGYIPASGFQLRGKGLYDFEPIISDLSDQDSLDAYGENAYAYDMPYQSDPLNAVELGQFILALNKDPQTRVDSITFVANWSDELMELALFLEISERVSVTADSIGLAATPYFVNGVKYQIDQSGLMLVTFDLCPTDTSQFWLLGVDGRSELDETTVLGFAFFQGGWILDEAALGVETYAA